MDFDPAVGSYKLTCSLMIDAFLMQKLLKTSANPKAAKKKKKAAEKVLIRLP